jgi:hypothetical protein
MCVSPFLLYAQHTPWPWWQARTCTRKTLRQRTMSICLLRSPDRPPYSMMICWWRVCFRLVPWWVILKERSLSESLKICLTSYITVCTSNKFKCPGQLYSYADAVYNMGFCSVLGAALCLFASLHVSPFFKIRIMIMYTWSDFLEMSYK